MPTIDAEVSGAEANSYLTLEEADERLDEFTNADKWDDLQPEDRQRLLLRAARMADRYKNWPPRAAADQRLAFPTVKDAVGVIPLEVKNAILEIVDHLLDGTMESLKKLQAEGVTSVSILGQNVSTSDFVTSPMDRSQLPGAARQELDRLYAKYQAPIVQGRAYDGSDDEDGTSLFG